MNFTQFVLLILLCHQKLLTDCAVTRDQPKAPTGESSSSVDAAEGNFSAKQIFQLRPPYL